MSIRLVIPLIALLLLRGNVLRCQGTDVDPVIESSHVSATNGRDVTVVFVAHSEDRGACSSRFSESVVSEQSPFSFHICAASSPSKTSSQPEYDLRMSNSHRPDMWFHMIITPKYDEEIDDQFVWTSFFLKDVTGTPVQLRFPVHPRITTAYLSSEAQSTLFVGALDDTFKRNVSLKSTLQRLNLRVTGIKPSVSDPTLETVTTRDSVSSERPLEIPPRQSRDVVLVIAPAGWRGFTKGIWDLKPDQTDGFITLSIDAEPELGGVSQPQDITVPVHMEAHPIVLALFLIVGTVVGVLIERLAIATPTQTVTPFLKTWSYGLLLAFVAWVIAAALPGTASSTVLGVPISTGLPLDIFLLGFFLAGGRAVASKLKLS